MKQAHNSGLRAERTVFGKPSDPFQMFGEILFSHCAEKNLCGCKDNDRARVLKKYWYLNQIGGFRVTGFVGQKLSRLI
ncbi:MAG: hypothetical protein ACXW1W_05910 [Methylococcaceae bacterium]